MLPPINLLNTDLVDLGTESPMDTRFYRDSSRFQASLGEALDAPSAERQTRLPLAAGQALPPDGNILPAEILSPVLQFDTPSRLRSMVTGDGEWSANSILPTAESAESINAAEELVMDESASIALTDMSDESAAVTASIRPELRGQFLALPVNVAGVSQPREQTQRPLPSALMPVSDRSVGSVGTDQLVAQQIESNARVATAGQLVMSGSEDAEIQAANVSSTNFRQFAEKFDGVEKRIGAVAQAALSATDTATLSQGPLQASRIAAPPLVQTTINIPVLDDGWAEALNERVTWMAGSSIHKAEIRLNPADMGPIRVEVSVKDDVATVTFNAQHAVTREAIELAMPRLREMLNENGISLANTDVSDADVRHGEHAGGNGSLGTPDGITDGGNDVDDSESIRPASVATGLPSGLVDTFV